MSAEKKVKLASDFFKLAHTLQNSKSVNAMDEVSQKKKTV